MVVYTQQTIHMIYMSQLILFFFQDLNINNITSLHNFKFMSDGILCYRNGTIGQGAKIVPTRKEYHFLAAFLYEEKQAVNPSKRTKIYYHVPGTKVRGVETTVDEPVDQSEANELFSEGAVWHCPKERCDSTFLRYSAFLKHKLSENCTVKTRVRDQSIGSYVLKTYSSKYQCSKVEEKLTVGERRHLRTHLDDLNPVHLDEWLYCFTLTLSSCKNKTFPHWILTQ